ncbi:MAG: hypothetical protein LM590_08920 [Thermofilum sp.]|nr:hypothetical protein [Thermofilum sp.]
MNKKSLFRESFFSILIFVVILVLNWKWICSIQKSFLGIEEGFWELVAIKVLSNSQNVFWFDSRTYGQPDLMPYGKAIPYALAVILNYIIYNESITYILTFIFLEFFASYAIFILLRQIHVSIFLAFVFSIMYIITNPIIFNMYSQGHLRFLIILFCNAISPTIIYIFLESKNKLISYICYMLAFIINLVFIFANIVIFMAIFALSLYMYPFLACHKPSGLKFKIFLVIISIIPALVFWSYSYLYYSEYFVSEFFGRNTLEYSQMSNLISFIFLNWGMSNRTPIVVQAMNDIVLNLILSFPFFASLTFLLSEKEKWLILFTIIIIMLAGCGTYGPFFALYLKYNLPFRAPGRIFLPISHPFLIIMGALGFNKISNVFISSKGFFKLKKITKIVIYISLLWLAFYISTHTQFTYAIPPSLEEAYSRIPPYSRVLMLPVWGNVGSGFSLSYNGTYVYQPFPTVGHSIMHLHEYLCAKYNLKEAFSPPSRWETPTFVLKTIEELWYDDILKSKFDDFYLKVKLLFNLQYLIIYKHIMPSNIINGLLDERFVEKYFENDYILILKIKNQTDNEILISNYAFSISGVMNIQSVIKMLNCFGIDHPIIFMNDVKFQNKNLIHIYTYESNASMFFKNLSDDDKVILIVNYPIDIHILSKFINNFRYLVLEDNGTYYILSSQFFLESFVVTNCPSKNFVYLFNFDPNELKRVKIYYIYSPKGYRSDYIVEPPISEGFLLLAKSYSPLFRIIYDGKRDKSYLANLFLNAFYFANCSSLSIKFEIFP